MQRNFLITGAARGIGCKLVTALSQAGDRVFATDVRLQALEDTAKREQWEPARVFLSALDVRKPEEWRAVMAGVQEKMGTLDVCMNVAGVLLANRIEDVPDCEIDLQVDVNLKGVIFGTRAAVQFMLTQGYGHIVNIASIAGLTPVPRLSVYAATKYAVRAFSVSTALELRTRNIAVTAVCPTTVQTPMLEAQLHNDAADLYYSGRRILTVDEVADAIINHALPKRPYVLTLPRSKGWLARSVDLFPTIATVLEPLYSRSGRRRQTQRRFSRPANKE